MVSGDFSREGRGAAGAGPSLLPSVLAAALAAAVLAALASAPFWAGRADLRLLMEALSYLALAQMWNLLAGYAGLISVGQQAFVGLGGYAVFALAIFGGVPLLSALPLAGLAAALAAIPTGWALFRLQGAYFAIGAWVLAEAFRLSAAQIGALGGGSGISLPVRLVRDIGSGRAEREMILYYIALALALGCVLGVWALLRARWGLALTAIRDGEAAARAAGVRATRVKFAIWVGAAGVTGMIGAFIFLQKLRITPDAAFSVNDWTAFVIFMVVIGGIGSIEGPVIGVIAFFALREVAADWGPWYLIGMGALAIGVMLADRRGLWGALHARTGWEIFPTRRRLD